MTAPSDAPLLRRTRWRLIAWSGGSTLAVLLVLGATIYAVTAASLANAGTAQLQKRLDELLANKVVTFTVGPNLPLPVTQNPGSTGVLIGGGEASGTIAYVVPVDRLSEATQAGPAIAREGLGLPDEATLAAVEQGRIAIQEATMGITPIRLLAAPVPTPYGLFAAVVVADRTTEVATLRTLLLVLLVGGLLVLVASLVVGALYAGRALVPIRESLRRQREFAADASHELRTPLAITRAAIADLRRNRTDPAAVDRSLADLDAGTARLEQLVGDLLLLARTDAEAVELEPVETDLASVAAEATESLEPVAAERKIRLVLDVQPAPLRGDEGRLRQLVGILVDNAIRHSPTGGRITVAVRAGGSLVVEDEGQGIAPADAERVFERFWRAPDAPAGGTGLGLAIARWIVECHRGTIAAGNREGASGARFTVRLPV